MISLLWCPTRLGMGPYYAANYLNTRQNILPVKCGITSFDDSPLVLRFDAVCDWPENSFVSIAGARSLFNEYRLWYRLPLFVGLITIRLRGIRVNTTIGVRGNTSLPRSALTAVIQILCSTANITR